MEFNKLFPHPDLIQQKKLEYNLLNIRMSKCK